ncbi:FAD-dependent oxidoreductase [Primorskyibacter aestuariivivens]|uniref:FAD-dependent oxidoreductase n=1 Tax=Primorskyibacter aestuariivivens TaxID=1888912 RepID=UPI002300DF91|nr:FAD-dependent oxidoreductase [Primorskyibacter aestuariivivens]MDA7428896.1 FAD-dependent oxidoreductase [Primorskyibacter aestuariivivens]
MSLLGLDICVIGGGIGGLAAALTLSARGAQVTVLEQAEAIREVGAGLQISPNGLRVIEALGLREDLAARSVRGRTVSLRNHRNGAEVARLDLYRLPPDQGYFFVHRADLIDILYTAAQAQGVKIRLLQRVDHVMPGPRPSVVLQNGDHRGAALVIGADGLHSKLRTALNGVAAPGFTGQVAWRAVIPNVTGQGAEAQVHMGPGRHLVCYPMRDGSIMNLVAAQERHAWVDEGWHHEDDPANLRAAFAGFGPQVRQMLNAVETVNLWGLFRHPVAARWQDGTCALLGDAAHPTLPFMAQGANMALEDAWALADCLASHDDPAAGLAAYEAARRPRCQKVVATATGNAWKYHLRPGPFRFAAHAALRLGARIAPDRLLGQFDWLYGYDVTRAL